MPGIKKLLSGKRSEALPKTSFLISLKRILALRQYHETERGTLYQRLLSLGKKERIPCKRNQGEENLFHGLRWYFYIALQCLIDQNVNAGSSQSPSGNQSNFGNHLTQMQELATTLPEYEVVHAVKGVGIVLAAPAYCRNR